MFRREPYPEVNIEDMVEIAADGVAADHEFYIG